MSLGVDLVTDLDLRLTSMGVKLMSVNFYVDASVVVHQINNPWKAEVHSRLNAVTTAQYIDALKGNVILIPTTEQKADCLTKFHF